MSARKKDIPNELVNKCLSGDKSGYRELYELYSKAMYNICCRIVNDEDDAHDVLQEGFISAFKNIDSFKAESTFGAWLKKIMINKSISFIKKKRLLFESLNEDTEVAENGEGTESENVDFELNIKKIQRGIELLPDGYRAVLSLYLIEGYDHSEIAEILGISESTSKSQFNRSKKKLREIIKSMNYGK